MTGMDYILNDTGLTIHPGSDKPTYTSCKEGCTRRRSGKTTH